MSDLSLLSTLIRVNKKRTDELVEEAVDKSIFGTEDFTDTISRGFINQTHRPHLDRSIQDVASMFGNTTITRDEECEKKLVKLLEEKDQSNKDLVKILNEARNEMSPSQSLVIDSLRNQISTQQQTISSLRTAATELSNCQSKFLEISGKLSEKESSLNDLEVNLSERDTVIEETKKILSESRETLRKLQENHDQQSRDTVNRHINELEDKDSQLTNLRKERNLLEEKIKTLEGFNINEKNSLEADVSRLLNEVREKSSQILGLDSSIDSLKQQLESSNNRGDACILDLEEREKEIGRLQGENGTFILDLEEREKEIGRLQGENGTFILDLEEREKEIGRLQEENGTFILDLEEREKEIGRLQEEKGSLESRIRVMDNSIEDIEKKLEESLKKNRDLEFNNAENGVNNSLERAKQTQEISKQKLMKKELEIKLKNAEEENILQDLKTCRDKNVDLEKKIRSTESQLINSSLEKSNLVERLSARENNISALAEQNRVISFELEKLQNETEERERKLRDTEAYRSAIDYLRTPQKQRKPSSVLLNQTYGVLFLLRREGRNIPMTLEPGRTGNMDRTKLELFSREVFRNFEKTESFMIRINENDVRVSVEKNFVFHTWINVRRDNACLFTKTGNSDQNSINAKEFLLLLYIIHRNGLYGDDGSLLIPVGRVDSVGSSAFDLSSMFLWNS